MVMGQTLLLPVENFSFALNGWCMHARSHACIYSVWCLVSLVVSLPRPSPSYRVDSN